MAGPSGQTPRLILPYPIPDDTVDVPRDVKALADKLDGIDDLGVPYPGLGCSLAGTTAAGAIGAFPQLAGQTGSESPPVRQLPAGSLGGTYGCTYTVPVAGVWRFSASVRLDNQTGGKTLYANRVLNGTPASAWNIAGAYGATPGSYIQGFGSEDLSLNAGDTLTLRFSHDDNAARTISWRMMIDRIA